MHSRWSTKKIFGQMILVWTLDLCGFILHYSYRLYLLQIAHLFRLPKPALDPVFQASAISAKASELVNRVLSSIHPSYILLPPTTSKQSVSKPLEEKVCRTLLLIIETSNNSVWQKPFKSATLFSILCQDYSRWAGNYWPDICIIAFPLLPLFLSGPN